MKTAVSEAEVPDMKNKTIFKVFAVICLLAGFAGCFALGLAIGQKTATAKNDIEETDTGRERFPEEVLQSIVRMEIYDGSDKCIATASGFIAFEPRRLVTCRHVLVNMSYAICTTEAGESFRIDTICEADEELDIAFCVLPQDCMLEALTPAEESPKRGDSITAVGSQFGLVNVVTCGNVSMVKDTYILFTAPVNSGSSGGVLLNGNGEVCGVVRGTYGDGQSINVAVPIEKVVQLSHKK